MIINIALLIIAISVALIALYLIPTLKQIQKTARTLEVSVEEINTRIKPILEETDKAIRDIQEVILTTKIEVERVGETVEGYRKIAERIHKLTGCLYEQVEMPLYQGINTVNAFKFGFTKFLGALINLKKEE